jgi:hypothetical protein
MAHNPDDFSVSSGSDLSIKSFNQVKSTTKQLPPPAFISDTVIPEDFSGKWRVRISRVTDEASGGVGIET